RVWWLLLRADKTGMGRSWRRAGFYQVTRFSSFWEGPGAAGGSFEGQHVCGSRLASIPGQVIELRFPWGGWSAWREPEAQGAAVPPGDRHLEVGEAGVDEDGVVAAQVQRAGDVVPGDVQGSGGVEEVPPDLVGGGVVVPVELEREQPVEVAGDDG